METNPVSTHGQGVRDTIPAIKSLHVLTSGWAEQHKEHRYGTWMPKTMWALLSRSWVKLPVNYFLIEHRDGLILFDTGLDPEIFANPNYVSSPIGRFFLRRLFRFDATNSCRLDNAVKAAGFTLKAITRAVISHLHFDHIGGIAQIPQAELIVSDREWAQLSTPQPERDWILREHIEIPGAQWHPISFQPTDDPLLQSFGGSYDVAGDGSMILLPTPGHTPGSLSMLIRREGWPPILLVGDLTYEAELLEQNKVPGLGDAAELRRSYAKVRNLKEQLPDLVIAPSHDLSTSDNISRATGQKP
ncbi:N-acyl homoserine lactonase family protein [Parvibaculaceae bacterium PLY_AMNH_Bact1]|nr:N-acyl homoserine lactonase family protein [Parvibaculaceae bacterium PLY_AMNH_Bact1]